MLYESLGAKLIYMSFFSSLARAIEILLKPAIANFSDSLISKYGRRKPFMIIGSIMYVIFLLLVFRPPLMEEHTYENYISLWFGIFYVLFFISDTIVNVPYLALGPEITQSSKERERLYVYFYLFQYIGVLVAASGPVIISYLLTPECNCNECLYNTEIVSVDLCIEKCNLFCNLQSNITSLQILSYVISIEFIVSITLLCIFIKEKYCFADDSSSIISYKHESILSKIYQMLKNKPFLSLIFPWVIDVSSSTIFSTMLPFYLNTIINPQKYCIENNIPLNTFTCNSQIWLGICVTVFFITCILSMSFWHWLVSLFGKKLCWRLYSLLSFFTFLGFYFVSYGEIEKVVFFSIIAAIPAGGTYINDVNLTDTIDYDEFLSNNRNEAIYSVFISFIPKFVSIFAQALPISILAFTGFESSQEGIVQEQNDLVLFLVKFFFYVVPSVLSLISFIIKGSYPINSSMQVDMIHVKIDLVNLIIKNKIYNEVQCDNHNENKDLGFNMDNNENIQKTPKFILIKDPIYNTYRIFLTNQKSFSEKEANTYILYSHFCSMYYFSYLLRNQLQVLYKIINESTVNLACLLFLFCVGLYITIDFLEIQSLNFIPILFIFVITLLIILLVLNSVRRKVLTGFIFNNKEFDYELLRFLLLKHLHEENVIESDMDRFGISLNEIVNMGFDN